MGSRFACVYVCYRGVHITFVQLHVYLCVHAWWGWGVLSITIHLIHWGVAPHFISEFAGSSHLSSLLSSFSCRPWGSGGFPHHLPFTWVLGTELHSLPLFCVQETVHHFSRQLLNWKHGIQETHCFQISERKQPKILYLTEILLKKANNIMTFSGKQ